MNDRASKALTEGFLPGETYNAFSKRKDVPLTTVYHREDTLSLLNTPKDLEMKNTTLEHLVQSVVVSGASVVYVVVLAETYRVPAAEKYL
jgi:hypothetical protein